LRKTQSIGQKPTETTVGDRNEPIDVQLGSADLQWREQSPSEFVIAVRAVA